MVGSQELVVARRRNGFLFHALGYLGKVPGFAEVLVDACKANVSHVVEGFQSGHDGLSDTDRRDLVAQRLELALHPAYQAVDPGGVEIALAAGVANGSCKLVAVEWLALGVFLDDREIAQLNAFESSEPCSASLALPSTAYCGSVFTRPAVLNLAVLVRTEWAAHSLSLVNREARTKLEYPLVDASLHTAVVLEAVLGKPIENVSDHG